MSTMNKWLHAVGGSTPSVLQSFLGMQFPTTNGMSSRFYFNPRKLGIELKLVNNIPSLLENN